MAPTEERSRCPRLEEIVAKEMGKDMAKKWKELYPDKPIKVGFIDFLSVAFCIDQPLRPLPQGCQGS